jgi:hypothetical protein
MIDFGRIILVGRHEKISEERQFVLTALAPLLERAAQAMRERWPDRLDAWERWNVVAWHVDRSPNPRIDLLRFEGLGQTPLPHLTERWVYVSRFHHIDPMEVPNDPPLLHRSSQVLDADNLPPEATVSLPKADRKGRVERILDVERALEVESLLDAPQGQTVRGMENLMRWKGLRLSLIEGSVQRWRLENIPDAERWTTVAAGGRIDAVVPSSLKLLGPRGLAVARKVERKQAAG